MPKPTPPLTRSPPPQEGIYDARFFAKSFKNLATEKKKTLCKALLVKFLRYSVDPKKGE